MHNYRSLLRDILDFGLFKQDRTDTGTVSLFGRQLGYDMSEGFPVVTTKKLQYESVEAELSWFLRGETNINTLTNSDGKRIKIWDAWADNKGDLGKIYGYQWRKSGGKDQLAEAIDLLKTDPDSRRIIIDSWNVNELDSMALYPCHTLFQFWTAEIPNSEKRYISCQLYQRSADMFLGVPFNIASYSLLLHIIAKQLDMIPHEFIWCGGDCHIYLNHFQQVKEQIKRKPYNLPSLKFNREDVSIDNFLPGDSCLVDYKYHPAIKAPIAV